jgi:quercetin dioxygenase-like cupin family protein
MLTPIATLQRTVGTSVTRALCILTTAVCNLAYGQIDPRRGPAGCVPVSERQMERGCYVLVSEALGEQPRTPLFWQIDSFPTKAAAESAKGPRGTVMEALGKIWLLSIAEEGYRPTGGTHAAEIGPLLTDAATRYVAAYMQAIMAPGAETGVHHHPGPEVLYTVTGQECRETEQGKFAGRPGGPAVIVPAGVQHRLTITGTEERTSLVLILYDASQPFTIRTHAHTWTPKELCH